MDASRFTIRHRQIQNDGWSGLLESVEPGAVEAKSDVGRHLWCPQGRRSIERSAQNEVDSPSWRVHASCTDFVVDDSVGCWL